MTSKYFFANHTPIDLAAIELMGVSVKEGASPIGYFGTGLKFAIATCLRHGQGVTLRRINGLISFQAFPEEVRGKTFQRIFMLEAGEAKPLGFTTELGRNWQLWQAFREFESNCRDENGTSGPICPDGEWGTIFEVEGEAFAEAAKTSGVFLASQPLYANSRIEIHPLGQNPRAIYHRGVLAGELPKPGLFTYNDLDGTLTEDRTLATTWWTAMEAGNVLARQGREGDLERVLLAGEGFWERDSFNSWSGGEANPAFNEIVKTHRLEARLNGWAKRHWLAQGDNEQADWTRVEMDGQMLATARTALKIVRRMGAPMGIEDFRVVRGLGSQAYGVVSKGQIYISPTTFDMGPRFLASTLYEEWLHLHEGLTDESRAMQNWLFERLSATTEALMEAEARTGPTTERIVLNVSEEARAGLDTPPKPMFDDEIPF